MAVLASAHDLICRIVARTFHHSPTCCALPSCVSVLGASPAGSVVGDAVTEEGGRAWPFAAGLLRGDSCVDTEPTVMKLCRKP